MFSGSDAKGQEVKEAVSETPKTPDSQNAFKEEPPVQRRVIQAPVIIDQAGEDVSSDQILIKAEPSRENDQCKFMVNRSLFKGHSWFFPDFESAAGSPLAESVFSIDTVDTMLIHDSTAVVTKFGPKGLTDWESFAKEVGSAIRKALEAGTELVSKDIIKTIPSEDVVREDIQKVIDTEVNPGVAGHGGHITLTSIAGNTVTIQMGGGCQGCSAADLTLKQGIHNSFRKAVPYIGAIYDETDHAAGSNPYYR